MILYIALGDSITAGESATHSYLTYPSLVVSMLQKIRHGEMTEGEVLASPGWTSADLNAAVTENTPFYLSKASVITIWVGGDDLTIGGLAARSSNDSKQIAKAIQVYKSALSSMIQRIKTISKAPIIVCTQYNPFPNTPIASTGIGLLNQTTLSVCHHACVNTAPIHAWFEGREFELVAGYQSGRIEDVFKSAHSPIHPNNKGHKVIAEGLCTIIQATIAKPVHW